MRNSDRAFVAMQERLEGVRQSGIPFGFIFTLTQHNIHELEWVADFALDQGAKLLQIHPLEEVGRAEQQLSGSGPDSVESAYTYLEVLRIQAQVGDKLYLQLDLANQNAFRAEPARAYAGHPVSNVEVTGLADLTSPLVIEADGTVVPLQYGFARRYALGSLLQSSLSELALIWRRDRYPSFRRLCQRVYDDAVKPSHSPLFNWYDTISREAITAGTQLPREYSST